MLLAVSVILKLQSILFKAPFSFRDSHQQSERDHAVAEAETSQHRGAERGGCWQQSGEVLPINYSFYL